MVKEQKTAEQIYKSNQKKAKIFKILAPICFFGFLAIAVVCLALAIRYSLGNMVEMLNLLNDKVYTGEQLQANYNYLISKYGSWRFGNGGTGFTMEFINVANVVFSNAFIFFITMTGLFVLGAFLLGKWIFPKLAKQIESGNQDMVNITILKNSENK